MCCASMVMSVREEARALSPTSVENIQRQKNMDHITNTKKNWRHRGHESANHSYNERQGVTNLLILCTNTLPNPCATTPSVLQLHKVLRMRKGMYLQGQW